MKNTTFKFYSVLKNEDAVPYIGGNILVVADGLGGAGSTVHVIDRAMHTDKQSEIMKSAYGDMTEVSPELAQYIEELIAPMTDGVDDTSALWASRIVIARCVYALTEGGFKDAELSDQKVREQLAAFISEGLHRVAKKFDLQKGKYDGQLLLPTTLAFIRYTEKKHTVIAETLWAGDSRCYALTPGGLKVLSVDDEDSSGLITNLFYADNVKVTLNYLRHEIAKPCALMTVSDGVFDPFDPHDHLGVEHTLLSSIKECSSEEQLPGTLEAFYDGVHGDDATMAFAAFGFRGYEAIRAKLARRTREIMEVRQKQMDFCNALEVMNQTAEDASHYVLSRTRDRYDYIVSELVNAVESGVVDIAVTPEVKEIVESVKSDFEAAVEKARREKQEQVLQDLYKYVIANPTLASSQIFTGEPVDFHGNTGLENNFSDMKKNLAAYVAIKSDETTPDMEALNVMREELHRSIMDRIIHYRENFDRLWSDKASDFKLRSNIEKTLHIWENIDFKLQYNGKVSGIGRLPEEDRALAYEVSKHLDERRRILSQIKSRRSDAKAAHSSFVKYWNAVFDYLKSNFNTAYILLTPETVRKFGFFALEKDLELEIDRGKRERISDALKKYKDTLVPGIVRALAAGYNAKSLIDGQYNATRLELFRTYYRLQATDDGALKTFETQLAALEAEYTILITK